jgi:hypothetical protein
MSSLKLRNSLCSCLKRLLHSYSDGCSRDSGQVKTDQKTVTTDSTKDAKTGTVTTTSTTTTRAVDVSGANGQKATTTTTVKRGDSDSGSAGGRKTVMTTGYCSTDEHTIPV